MRSHSHNRPKCYGREFDPHTLKNIKTHKKGTTRIACNDCCDLGFSIRHQGDVSRQCHEHHSTCDPQNFDLKNDAQENKNPLPKNANRRRAELKRHESHIYFGAESYPASSTSPYFFLVCRVMPSMPVCLNRPRN